MAKMTHVTVTKSMGARTIDSSLCRSSSDRLTKYTTNMATRSNSMMMATNRPKYVMYRAQHRSRRVRSGSCGGTMEGTTGTTTTGGGKGTSSSRSYCMSVWKWLVVKHKVLYSEHKNYIFFSDSGVFGDAAPVSPPISGHEICDGFESDERDFRTVISFRRLFFTNSNKN